jgi:DNA gyrase subunit A
MEVVIRRAKYDLRKAEERAHILEGYLKALDHLDEVIKLIRASRTPDEAKENLIAKSKEETWYLNNSMFADLTDDIYQQENGLSEIQAKAILELRLQRLTGMERDKIVDEFNGLVATIRHLKELLGSELMRYELIKTELLEVKENSATRVKQRSSTSQMKCA